MDTVKAILRNKWFRFLIATTVYVLIFVVWMRSPWMLLGIPIIFDIYISKVFSRRVLKYHREWRKKNRTYKGVMEWVEAILFAVIVASLIHIFIFQMYVIPTPSMEKTLLVGDYLYVSKLTYGPRMPNTPLAFPLVHNTMPMSKTRKSYSEAIKLPYKRLAGIRPVRHDDVVVFNFPAGDTVFVNNPATTYYHWRISTNVQGGVEAQKELIRKNPIVTRPVDKRENYVKRCVGLPGDSIKIVASQLYVNGEPQRVIRGVQQKYIVKTTSPFSLEAFERMGISRSESEYNNSTGSYIMLLTAENAERIKEMANVSYVFRTEEDTSWIEIFPNDPRYTWTPNDFGPLWIPAKGATVELTADNLPLYERIIRVYEHNELDLRDGVIYINGQPATSYTFEMDYFWMMGDNRQNSADSRFWGFVPEDHVVGRASFVWLSLDREKSLFDGKIRWNKMFRKVR